MSCFATVWCLLFTITIGLIYNSQFAQSSTVLTINPHMQYGGRPQLSLLQTLRDRILTTAIPGSRPAYSPTQFQRPADVLAASTLSLYLDPEAQTRRAPLTWRTTRTIDAQILDKLATIPSALWFGDWNTSIESDARTRLTGMMPGQVAVIVAYNIPFRDCGEYSSGGANNDAAYISWIEGLARGIGAHKAMVILEPDAVANLDCLSSQQQQQRYSLLRQAIIILSSNKATKVYLDAGNSQWLPPSQIAQRLESAGIRNAAGFSLNVSNFLYTKDEIAYGSKISNIINGKHFVIDTSRNGNGPAPSYQWCNPEGRALGQLPTLDTDIPLVDGYLWIKTPGESDGNCDGAPNAGVWWPEYALGLAKRAGL